MISLNYYLCYFKNYLNIQIYQNHSHQKEPFKIKKQIASHMNDYRNGQDCHFYYNQWYQIVLDFTEIKSVKEQNY